MRLGGWLKLCETRRVVPSRDLLEPGDGLRVAGRVGGLDDDQELLDPGLDGGGVSPGTAGHEGGKGPSRGDGGLVCGDRFGREGTGRLWRLPRPCEPGDGLGHESPHGPGGVGVHRTQFPPASFIDRRRLTDREQVIDESSPVVPAQQLDAQTPDQEWGAPGAKPLMSW